MVKLCRQEVALDHGKLISDHVVVSFYLYKAVKIWRELLVTGIWWTCCRKQLTIFVQDFVRWRHLILHFPQLSGTKILMMVFFVASIILGSWINLLSILRENYNFFAAIFCSELFIWHLNEHVIINLMRSAAFELSSDSAIYRSIYRWLLLLLILLLTYNILLSVLYSLSYHLLKLLRMIWCLDFL